MHILIIHHEAIPVSLYGGTERVIWYLGKALVKMGHTVSYLVKKGSHADFARVLALDETRDVVDQIPDDVDIVHFHYHPTGLERMQKPYLLTMHGNVNDQRTFDSNTVFVSQNHAERFGAQAFVYNGLDWSDYTVPDWNTPRQSFHFLGNAAWRVKNVKGAIDVATSVRGAKLHVLGGVRFNFNMGIRLTFSPRVRFYGMVGGTQKDRLLNGSGGLIFPVRWHEPFGLAIIESMYYGCPVFGTPYGALPELVTPETGVLAAEKKVLSQAVANSKNFDPQVCHARARDHFNSDKMAEGYMVQYQKVLEGKPLNEKKPQLKMVQEGKFLPWG